MGNQISQQLLTFAQSILLGLAAGVLYDLLRPFRLRWPRCTGVLDGGYCLGVGRRPLPSCWSGERESCGDSWSWGPWAGRWCTSAPVPRCCGRCGSSGRKRWRSWGV